jgi:hypothetical protein
MGPVPGTEGSRPERPVVVRRDFCHQGAVAVRHHQEAEALGDDVLLPVEQDQTAAGGPVPSRRKVERHLAAA